MLKKFLSFALTLTLVSCSLSTAALADESPPNTSTAETKETIVNTEQPSSSEEKVDKLEDEAITNTDSAKEDTLTKTEVQAQKEDVNKNNTAAVQSTEDEITDSTGTWKYTINEDGNTVTLTRPVNKPSGEITIPSTLDGKSITDIGSLSFQYSDELSSVIISPGISSIGTCAFAYCHNLTSISLPNSIVSIGYEAFFDCTGLKSLLLPTGIANIGGRAFMQCSTLYSINLPDTITSIGYEAFSCCSSLSSVILPSKITCIQWGTFEHCTSLSSVNIPDNITSIESSAFAYCSSLSSLFLPTNITSIRDFAFEYCTKLSSINIPNSVSTLGNRAFQSCTNLSSVSLSNSLKSIPDGSFNGCKKLNHIIIPEGVVSIGLYAFSGCSNLSYITIPSSVTDIQSYAFENCTSLHDIYFAGYYLGVIDSISESTTIHYNSKGPDSESTNAPIFIRAIETNNDGKVIFHTGACPIPLTMYDYTFEGADSSFNLEKYTGQFILAETSGQDITECTLLETKVGQVGDYSKDQSQITIDGTDYKMSLPHGTILPSADSIGKAVYLLNGDTVVSVKSLKLISGTLDAWDNSKNLITISGTEYPLARGGDTSFLASIDTMLGKDIYLQTDGEIVYAAGIKDIRIGIFKTYDVFSKTIYLKDGTSLTASDDADFDINGFIDKLVICRLYNGKVSTIEPVETSLETSISLPGGDISYSNLQYSDNLQSKLWKKDFKINFEILISYKIKNKDVSIGDFSKDLIPSAKIANIEYNLPDEVSLMSAPEFNNTSINLNTSKTLSGYLKFNKFNPDQAYNNIHIQAAIKTNNNDESSAFADIRVLNMKKIQEIEKQKAETSDNIGNIKIDTSELADSLAKNLNCIIIANETDILKAQYKMTDSQIMTLKIILLNWLADISCPVDTNSCFKDILTEELSNEILSDLHIPSLENSAEAVSGNLSVKIPTEDYGNVLFIFSYSGTNFSYAGSHYGDFGTITWKVSDNSKGTIPYSMRTSTESGIFAKADLKAFANIFTKVRYDALKEIANGCLNHLNAQIPGQFKDEDVENTFFKAYHEYFTKAVIEAALKKNNAYNHGTKAITFSYEYIASLTDTWKLIKIDCPVDVSVFDKFGRLCGSIIDNKVQDGSKVYMYVIGDTKYVYLPDDEYSIKLSGTDTGTMNYSITEYNDDNYMIQKFEFKDIPLKKGILYYGNIPSSVFDDDDAYNLTESDTEAVIKPDSLTQYDAPVNVHGKDHTIKVNWENTSGRSLPADITVQPYYDGILYNSPVHLNANNNWSYTWKDLLDSFTWTADAVDCPDGFTKTVSTDGDTTTITYTAIQNDNHDSEDNDNPSHDSGNNDNPSKDKNDSENNSEQAQASDNNASMTKASSSTTPVTGDKSMNIFIILMVISSILIFAMAVYSKKKDTSK